jgi:hypothetical protein
LRNTVRKELGFSLEKDPDKDFIGKVIGDSTQE